jgi:hypothetical protein
MAEVLGVTLSAGGITHEIPVLAHLLGSFALPHLHIRDGCGTDMEWMGPPRGIVTGNQG